MYNYRWCPAENAIHAQVGYVWGYLRVRNDHLRFLAAGDVALYERIHTPRSSFHPFGSSATLPR